MAKRTAGACFPRLLLPPKSVSFPDSGTGQSRKWDGQAAWLRPKGPRSAVAPTGPRPRLATFNPGIVASRQRAAGIGFRKWRGSAETPLCTHGSCRSNAKVASQLLDESDLVNNHRLIATRMPPL
jgi:hypothetical protein